jgi:hypothetical protein
MYPISACDGLQPLIGRILNELRGASAERRCSAPQRDNGGISAPSLKAADIGLVDAHSRSKLLLREISSVSESSNVSAKNPPDIHPSTHTFSRMLKQPGPRAAAVLTPQTAAAAPNILELRVVDVPP